MEVKIGVQYAPRELVLESAQTASDVVSAIGSTDGADEASTVHSWRPVDCTTAKGRDRNQSNC